MKMEGLRKWPAAVGVNSGVNLGHELKGFLERKNHFLVMLQVVVGQCATPVGLQPFLANLITSNVKFPCLRRNVFKVLLQININAALKNRLGCGWLRLAGTPGCSIFTFTLYAISPQTGFGCKVRTFAPWLFCSATKT
jgi:hypothetical protein